MSPNRTAAAAETDYAVAPGEYVGEWMSDRGLSAQQLAELLGCRVERVTAILDGIQPIAPVIAEALARVVGIPAVSWLRYETVYRTDLTRISEQTNVLSEKHLTTENSVGS